MRFEFQLRFPCRTTFETTTIRATESSVRFCDIIRWNSEYQIEEWKYIIYCYLITLLAIALSIWTWNPPFTLRFHFSCQCPSTSDITKRDWVITDYCLLHYILIFCCLNLLHLNLSLSSLLDNFLSLIYYFLEVHLVTWLMNLRFSGLNHRRTARTVRKRRKAVRRIRSSSSRRRSWRRSGNISSPGHSINQWILPN